MPSLRHELLAWAVPRLRGGTEAPTVPGPLPTGVTPFFARRFSVVTEDVGGFASYVITPRGIAPRRTVVYLHGGSYAYPLDPFHVRYVARLARALEARVALPEYPLAPVHTWRDSHEPLADLTTRWAAESPDGVVLAGDSAGGGLALALALTLRDRGGPQPTHLVLHSPWVDLTTSTPETAALDAVDPWLDLAQLQEYAAQWAGTPEDLGRPEVSPALADLAGLPPAVMFCGTRDLLVAGCRLLADRAAATDWQLRYVEKPDLVHVYPLLPTLPEAGQAFRQTLEFLGAP